MWVAVGGTKVETLTHTKRRDWKNCRRYYLHRHIQHLSPRRQKRGRRRGSLFGEGIQLAVETFKDQAPPSASTLHSFFWQWLEVEYERLVDTGNFSPDEYAELEIERVKLGVILTGYIEKYGLTERREVEFYLPLRNPRTNRTSRAFQVGGKIDGIVVTGEKQATVIEDKLVGQIQQVMIERLELDDQTCEYVDAFAAKGWTADVWYRHTRFPSMNPAKPKKFKTKDDYPGESLDEFADRLLADLKERPAFYYDEQILNFPKLQMDDYRRGRWGVAQQILEARRYVATERQTEFFEKNPSRCWEYGGCEFIPLCCQWPDAEALYVEVEDNPELSEGITAEYANS